jgi:ribose transport system permease protein
MTISSAENAAPAPRKRMNILFSLTLVGLLLFLWLLLGVWTASFWTPLNISNLLRQGSMTAILAVGQTSQSARSSALPALSSPG